MKLTDEQYENVGNQIFKAMEDGSLHLQQEMVGRAAVAAVAPLLLAELQHASDEEWSTIAKYYQFKGLFLISFADLNLFLRNRLASVTAKPDPLREALSRWVSDGDMDEAIAAVDKARAK